MQLAFDEEGSLASASVPARLVVVHDAYNAGQCAFEVIERARLLGGVGHAVSKSFWNFGMLQITGLRELAASEAAEADVVVVSTFDTSGLAPEVGLWLNELAFLPTHRPRVLVALMGPPLDGFSTRQQTRQDLEQIVSRNGFRSIFVHVRKHLGWWVPCHDPLEFDHLARVIFDATVCHGTGTLSLAGDQNNPLGEAITRACHPLAGARAESHLGSVHN